MDPPRTPAIERFSHWFLTLEGRSDSSRIQKLTCNDPGGMLTFFGLEENPFGHELEPEILLKIPRHASTLLRLRQGVEDEVPLGMLSAPGGMGRSIIVRLLKQSLCKANDVIVDQTVEEELTATAFLKKILYDCGFSDVCRENASPHDLMQCLRGSVIKGYTEENKRLVLLLAEAQFLSPNLWHFVKMISNIEIPQKKLTTIVLFGDATLTERLLQKDLASLWNRTYIKENIGPLTLSETRRYLQNKLDRVNFRGSLFGSGTYDLIFAATGGICREIDNLAHNALIEAFSRGRKTIDSKVLMPSPD